MCGRFTLIHTADELARIFQVRSHDLALAPSYNVAPRHSSAVVLGGPGQHELRLMHWGLIPSWATDARIGDRMINARAETAAEKPAFRQPFRRRRCVVPASGFYEWKRTADGKTPHYITSARGQVLPLAGLWDRWNVDRDTVVETFTIVTTVAGAALAPIHHRMPVILAGDRWLRWLHTPERQLEKLASLLVPCADDLLAIHPVSRRVNSPQANDAGLIRPLEDSGAGEPAPGETRSLF
ncbi:MAG: SOS response-associated peptidase [Planctomycetes bacterium]|nr:SOS response-associated peptidase [Planctomycetota bacterium]